MFGNRRFNNNIFRAFDEMLTQLTPTNGEWKTQTKVSEDGTIFCIS